MFGNYVRYTKSLAGVLLAGIVPLCAYADAALQRVRSSFDIQQAYCAIKTNDVTGFDNRDSAWRGRGGGTSSTNALILMENGENEISLEIGALGWFSDKPLTTEEQAHFDPQSACSLELVRFSGQEKQSIASIKVTIGPQGIPEVHSDNKSTVIRTRITAEQVVPGYIDPNYFDENYFPQGMYVYRFTRKVIMQGIPDWAWVNAEPFTGSDEQIRKLKAAYSEMADIISSGDRKRLKAYEKTALAAWSLTTGDSEDEILLSRYPKNELEGRKAKMIPIKWENYGIRVMNKGRLVRMYNKSDLSFSPLTYKYIDEEGDEQLGYYSPVFSFVDGRFVPVI